MKRDIRHWEYLTRHWGRNCHWTPGLSFRTDHFLCSSEDSSIGKNLEKPTAASKGFSLLLLYLRNWLRSQLCSSTSPWTKWWKNMKPWKQTIKNFDNDLTLLFYFIEGKTETQRGHITIRADTVRTGLKSRLPNSYWAATTYRTRMRKRNTKGREQCLVNSCWHCPVTRWKIVSDWLHTTRGRRRALLYSIWQFLWCKHCHAGWL